MRSLVTPAGASYLLPLFLPVFEPGNPYLSMEQLKRDYGIEGIITNGYLIYKRRELKRQVLAQGIKSYLGFDGLVVTDSGAFQQFSGPLYLSNKKIIAFQQEIGADVVSPLDLITTPGDNRTSAEKKLAATLKRIREGLPLTDRAILIGVQQGGRFHDLRRAALTELAAIGVRYVALGSLVPFFNRNHDIGFVGRVIQEARRIVPEAVPIHLYGGGDPLELPFYIALGCDVFDSSSFVHYARNRSYMTPYGAVNSLEMLRSGEYSCEGPCCRHDLEGILDDASRLAAHNLGVILEVVRKAGEMYRDGTLGDYLERVAGIHRCWFPRSRLPDSWSRLRNGEAPP